MACKHHWMIGPQDGPTSEGVCCHCGERREFRNSVKEYKVASEARRLPTFTTARAARVWRKIREKGKLKDGS